MKSGNLNFLEPSGPPRPVMGLLYLLLSRTVVTYHKDMTNPLIWVMWSVIIMHTDQYSRWNDIDDTCNWWMVKTSKRKFEGPFTFTHQNVVQSILTDFY